MARPCQRPGLGRPRPGTGPGPAAATNRPGAAALRKPAQAGRDLRARGARGPVWRTLLEAQWRDQLQEVTEPVAGLPRGPPRPPARRRPRHRPARHRPVGPESGRCASCCAGTVAARRALADTEEALGRLASGRYGLCEGCAAAIPARLLAAAPDARYCSRCRPRPVRAPGPAMASAQHSEEDDRPAQAYCPVQARSSRSSVSAMLLAQILPLSMPARSSSGAREHS